MFIRYPVTRVHEKSITLLLQEVTVLFHDTGNTEKSKNQALSSIHCDENHHNQARNQELYPSIDLLANIKSGENLPVAGFGWFDGDIVFGQLFRALNPAVDIFHFGVGHRNFIVVVVSNVVSNVRFLKIKWLSRKDAT